MQGGVIGQIQALRAMSVGELRVRWREMYGEDCKSRNKEFLYRRLCWRTQELAYGGLSDAAKARIAELAPATFTRARVPNGFQPSVVNAAPAVDAKRTVRDARLPVSGSVILKKYKGRQLRVLVGDDHFEYDGRVFRSLSELARTITGSAGPVNGMLFFGLSSRRRSS